MGQRHEKHGGCGETGKQRGSGALRLSEDKAGFGKKMVVVKGK